MLLGLKLMFGSIPFPSVPCESNPMIWKGAVAAVFVRDPLGRAAPATTGVFRAIFGLTEAEARLAQALQAGTSLADYAGSQGLSVNTVYTHLRRLREKTGSSRITELIRKLNDIEVPPRAD